MTNTATPAPSDALLTLGDFTIPAGCRRIFVTAQLEPSNGDPRIQPTGFPDLGPVLYPDPSGREGLICLIESEASMANRLEEICMKDKYTGTLKDAFAKLPYLRAQTGTGDAAVLKTTSTLDGHRFASDFLAKGKAKFTPDAEDTLAGHIKMKLGMANDGKTMPIGRVPDIFPLVLSLDAMSLIHGFQISNEHISFVGLRLPRALSASLLGFGCERVSVPGIKFNVGQVESESGQAIFQKPRITAKRIEARFSIDVGLLASLRLVASTEPAITPDLAPARLQLLLSIALWKVASFLDLLNVELSLRTECKLRLKRNLADKGNSTTIQPNFVCEGAEQTFGDFPFASIAKANLSEKINAANLPRDRCPLTLQFS